MKMREVYKSLFGVIFWVLLSAGDLFGQSTIFHIKNYQFSNALLLNQQNYSKAIFDAYGKIVTQYNSSGVRLSYLFGGQELDVDLGVYFFPSRLYSTGVKRFFQVDPLSQYHSPYIFVGSDPINYIDHSGNMAKPLVLYHTDMTEPRGMETTMLDFKSQVGDAYYIPLRDFVNGRVGDLSEFNGTVFIKSHMGAANGGEVHLESDFEEYNRFVSPRGRSKVYLNSKRGAAGAGRVKRYMSIKGEDLGRDLRSMADAKGLNVKTIVAGGCFGEDAAQGIGKGFTSKPSLTGKATLRTIGTDKDQAITYVGDKTLTAEGYGATGETKMYTVPRGHKMYYDGDLSARPMKFERVVTMDKKSGLYYQAKDFSSQELTEFGREAKLPSSAGGMFKEFMFEY